jgi:hypothetical protein
MEKKPESFLSIFPLIKVSKMISDVNFQEGPVKNLRTELSDISIEYLKKLKSLADRYSIDLLVVSPPVRISKKEQTKNWETLKKQIEKENLSDIFQGYFSSIEYIDDSFFQDYNHLKRSYLEENQEYLLKKMLNNAVYSNMIDRQKKPNYSLNSVRGRLSTSSFGHRLMIDFQTHNKVGYCLQEIEPVTTDIMTIKSVIRIKQSSRAFIIFGADDYWKELIYCGSNNINSKSIIRSYSDNVDLLNSVRMLDTLEQENEYRVNIDLANKNIELFINGKLVNSAQYNGILHAIRYIGVMANSGNIEFNELKFENYHR